MTGAERTRLPVVAAGGQLTGPRPGSPQWQPQDAPDPIELMAAAVTSAVAEAGGRALLDRVTHLWVVPPLSLRHHDPATLLADRLGIAPAEVRCGGMGGNVPQWLVARAADLVVAGRRPCALVVGAEALATRRAAKQRGARLAWPHDGGFPEMWPPLEADMGVHPVERAHGLSPATATYALIETAMAHRRGLDPAERRRAMGRLMARCSAVAAANPHSWFPIARTAEELVTVTTDNRMVCFPYPKYVNAVMDVDMAAAVVVTDAAQAAELGLGPAEVAHIHGWADTTEVWHLSARPDPGASPALAACAGQALAMAGTGADEVELFDLYACFPSALAAAAEALGLSDDDPRPLTLTGGLPAHGGPGSNYVTHSLVNALQALRQGRGRTALVQGNGYYLTKHAVGVYGIDPPAAVPAPVRPDGDSPATGPPAVRTVVDGPDGPGAGGGEAGTVVAYTVPHGRDGRPEEGIVLVELAGGRRTVGRADAASTAGLLAGDAVGATVRVARDGADAGGASPNRVTLE